MVTFVFTNPRHHVDMMVPVAKKLAAQGEPTRFVSLAELRGFQTPDLPKLVPHTTVKQALPRWIRKDPSVGAGLEGAGGAAARSTAQKLAWHTVLAPRLRWLLRGSDVVVLPNDAAFPYGQLAEQLRRAEVPFALLQEGIRFPLPTEQAAGAPYGGGGASAVCVWGEASAEHFRKVGANVVITGTPRWDDVDPAQWRARGEALQAKLGLSERPLLFLSNTIDDQGFCTTAEKYDLFHAFLERAAPVLAGRPIVAKLHPRESVAGFRNTAKHTPQANVTVLDGSEPLFEVLAMGQAAVVLASTVGLEALAFGLPLGVLALPKYGHIFEYVERGAAVGLTLDNLARELPALVAGERPRADSFLERHLAHRGQAADRIASTLLELRSRRSS
ncbi:MAG TPA: hypothetical protein VFQ53_09340 [Kofleriaceae bacterium]|nr:hypothetical protein [Kofleriaceae bacterium]